jgi:hypothetical protein
MKRCSEFPRKRRYATRRDAETAILLSDDNIKNDLAIYYCGTCRGYHLTSGHK